MGHNLIDMQAFLDAAVAEAMLGQAEGGIKEHPSLWNEDIGEPA